MISETDRRIYRQIDDQIIFFSRLPECIDKEVSATGLNTEFMKYANMIACDYITTHSKIDDKLIDLTERARRVFYSNLSDVSKHDKWMNNFTKYNNIQFAQIVIEMIPLFDSYQSGQINIVNCGLCHYFEKSSDMINQYKGFIDLLAEKHPKTADEKKKVKKILEYYFKAEAGISPDISDSIVYGLSNNLLKSFEDIKMK